MIAETTASCFLFISHFVLYKKPLDPLFPERESINVTTVHPCSGEVKQRIFLNGHIDAAWEFPLNYHFGGIVFEIPGAAAVFGVLYYIVLSVCVLCGAGAWTLTAGLCGLVFVPLFVLVAFTYNHKRVVDGANDNLSGCYMGIAVLREMERFANHPEEWGTFLDVKHWPEIKKPEKYAGKELFFGTVTDPYNPQEETFQRTRALLEQLQGSGVKISIQTKSDQALRDEVKTDGHNSKSILYRSKRRSKKIR